MGWHHCPPAKTIPSWSGRDSYTRICSWSLRWGTRTPILKFPKDRWQELQQHEWYAAECTVDPSKKRKPHFQESAWKRGIKVGIRLEGVWWFIIVERVVVQLFSAENNVGRLEVVVVVLSQGKECYSQLLSSDLRILKHFTTTLFQSREKRSWKLTDLLSRECSARLYAVVLAVEERKLKRNLLISTAEGIVEGLE